MTTTIDMTAPWTHNDDGTPAYAKLLQVIGKGKIVGYTPEYKHTIMTINDDGTCTIERKRYPQELIATGIYG